MCADGSRRRGSARMKLPFVDHWSDDSEIHATFALSLCAISPEDALISSQGTSQPMASSQIAHQRNVRLMNLIARWPHLISFELHIVSKPSLLPEIPGRNR